MFFLSFSAINNDVRADAWSAIKTVLSFTFGNGLLEPCTKSAIKTFYGKTYNGVSTQCDEFEEPTLTDEIAGVFSSNKKTAVCSANSMVKNITRAVGTGVGAFFGGPLIGYILGNVVGNALECLIISAKAKSGFKKAAEYEVCYSGDGEGSPLPYTDKQIAKLLVLSNEKVSVSNIVDKYDKLCIHKVGTKDYAFYKDGDIHDSVYVHHADGYAYVMCASVFSACPCIYNVGRGVLTEPEYKRDDKTGVIQLDEQGHLAFKDEDEKRKYEDRYAKHCRIIRYKDLYEQQDDIASIFDEACFDLRGYSKRSATITAGIVQCFENTARNIFEKPIMSLKQTSKTNQQATLQYTADISFLEDAHKYLTQTIIQDRKYDNILSKKEADLSVQQKKDALTKLKNVWFNDEATMKVEYACDENGKGRYSGTTMAFYDKYYSSPSTAVTENCCKEDNKTLYDTCFQDDVVGWKIEKDDDGKEKKTTNENVITSLTMADEYDNFTEEQKKNFTRLVYTETAKLSNLIEQVKIQKTRSIKANNAQMAGETSFSMTLFDIFRNKIKALAVMALTLWFFLLGWKMINGDFGKMDGKEFGMLVLRVSLCYMVVFSESAKNYMFNLAIQTAQGVGMGLNQIMMAFRSQENNSWNNTCNFTTSASKTPKKVNDGEAVNAIRVTTKTNVCKDKNHKLVNSRYTNEGHTIIAYWRPECPSGYVYNGCEQYEASYLSSSISNVCVMARCVAMDTTTTGGVINVEKSVLFVPAVPIERVSGIKSNALLEAYQDYYKSLEGYGAVYAIKKGKLENGYQDFCISYGFDNNPGVSATDGIRQFNDVSCPFDYQDGKKCSDDNCYGGYCYKKICTSSETEEECKNKVATDENAIWSMFLKKPITDDNEIMQVDDYEFSCVDESSEIYCNIYDPNDQTKCIEKKCQPKKLQCETGMSLTCGRKAIMADGSLSDKCLSGVCYKDLTTFMPRPPFERPYKVFQYYNTQTNKWVYVKPRCHKVLSDKNKTPVYAENDPFAEDPKYSSSLNDYAYTCPEAKEKEGYVLDDGYRISDLIELKFIGSKNSDLLVFQGLLSYEDQDNLSDQDKVAKLQYQVIRTAVATIDSNGVVKEYDFIDDGNAAEGSLRAQYRIYLDSKLKALNKNSDYPVIKKYGGTRSYKHISFWDSMDCKIIQFLTFTGGDKGFQQDVESALSSAENGNVDGAIDGAITAFLQFVKFVFMVFPFGILVFALMFAIGAALFMLVARAAQQYVVCVFNLVLVIYLSPFVFVLWLFDQTKKALDSWLKDLQANVIGACVPFVTISMFLFVIDWVLFGDASKYVEENMFTVTGGINPECYDGHESKAPVGCLAVRLMKQFQMWDNILNFLISWVAIFKKETWILAGYLIYRALFAAIVIIIMTLMLDKMEEEIYKLTGGKPDTDIGGGFTQSASDSIKSGGMAGLEAMKFGFKTFVGALKTVPNVAKGTVNSIMGLAAGIAGRLGNQDAKEKIENIKDWMNGKKISDKLGEISDKLGNVTDRIGNFLKQKLNIGGRGDKVAEIQNRLSQYRQQQINSIRNKITTRKKEVIEKYARRLADRKDANIDMLINFQNQINSRTDLSQEQKDNMINEAREKVVRQEIEYEQQQKSMMEKEMDNIARQGSDEIERTSQSTDELIKNVESNIGKMETETIERILKSNTNKTFINRIEKEIHTEE